MLFQHLRGFRLADLAVFILVGSLQASGDHSSGRRAVWPTTATLHAVGPSLPRGGRATHAVQWGLWTHRSMRPAPELGVRAHRRTLHAGVPAM
jgi:hypothetical protein